MTSAPDAGESIVDDYDSLRIRQMPALSARRHPPRLPPLLLDLVEAGQRALAEPYRGITTDGAIRPGLFPIATGPSTRPLVDAGAAFLATLTPTQRESVTFPIDSDEWRRWCNVHIYLMRHGLLLEDLDQTQRDSALALIRASTSARGFDNYRNAMRINELLAEITEGPEQYGEWAYFISIFGTPSADEPWGWQLDGHHLNVHCFVLGDQIVMTPAFLGAEPCHARTGRYAGTRLFDDELRNGLAMVRSLDPRQAATAVLFGSTLTADLPPDRVAVVDGRMRASAFQDNARLAYEGLRADAMTDGQRRLLRDLVATYVGSIRDEHAAVKMAEIDRHLDETHFCWMGGTDDVGPVYYKVQSPVVLIEFDHLPGVVFDNEEPSRHHVHSVVRTPNGNDYGADLLRQHYERSHH